MMTLLYILAIAAVLGILWARYAPIDRDAWHMDPAEADPPKAAGVRLIGREAPRYPADIDTVLATFQTIALEEPRTRLLEGNMDEGMMTYVARSKVFGFPDIITIKAVSEGAQTKLAVISRARISGYDYGVNGKRLDRWLQEMRLRLGE